MSKIKNCGQVFTPDYLVCNILDTAGYKGDCILSKHIIDNSCGDGAFLKEIVNRYCSEFLKKDSDIERLVKDLQIYVHGIEADEEAYLACLKNLNKTVSAFNLTNVKWDITFGDSLKITKYDNLMDYVIGNPPYVRVHNLQDNYNEIKKYSFSNGGMTDLYLVFFEIGFNMLKKGGYLCYITPSSWINSLAGNIMRQYIKMKSNIVELIDLGHFQPFQATTYTLISLFQKDIRHESFNLYGYNEEVKNKIFIDTLSIEDVYINDTIYLSKKEQLNRLREIKYNTINSYVSVKNGFATLADDIFIKSEFNFSDYIISICKASTGKWYKAFYPYDKKGKPISKEILFSNASIAQFLNENKEQLLKNKTEEENYNWFLFGRTQALKDVYIEKWAINTVIKDIRSIKLNHIIAGCGVYSGLYILTKVPQNILEQAIFSDDFIEYIKLLKKYKSGGYYTFNSKELELYLNYKINQILNDYENDIDKQSIFENNRRLF